MAHLVRVIPREGLLVRDPVNKAQIPAEGAVVQFSSHWTRQELAGDVVLEVVEPEAPVSNEPAIDPPAEAVLEEV